MAKGVRGSDQFQIRLPPGMRERIKIAADANNRSMNAEIVATLEDKYPEPEPLFQAVFDLYHLYVMDLVAEEDLNLLPELSKGIFDSWVRMKLFTTDGSSKYAVDRETLRSSAEHILHKRNLTTPTGIREFIASIRDPEVHIPSRDQE